MHEKCLVHEEAHKRLGTTNFALEISYLDRSAVLFLLTPRRHAISKQSPLVPTQE